MSARVVEGSFESLVRIKARSDRAWMESRISFPWSWGGEKGGDEDAPGFITFALFYSVRICLG